VVTKSAGAATGAAAGSALGGPVGAAIGGAGGYLAAETFGPEDMATGPLTVPETPDDIWSLLGLLVDRAYWLVILAGVAYLLALFLPSPKDWKIWGKARGLWRRIMGGK